MDAYQPYPEYKDSGVEWLGQIPAHWEVRRLKTAIKTAINGIWGDVPQNDENDLVCIRVADFDYDSLGISTANLTIRNIPPSKQAFRLLNKGDLLIEKSGGGDIWPVGRVVSYNLDHKAVCSNFIAKLTTSEDVDSHFLCYVFVAAYAVALNTRSIKQTTGIQNLDLKSYLNELMGFPPLPEQRAIAAFLDRETAHIDALIARKRELIDLLHRQRTAIISHAITKGLDPTVPLKDSGIEWLGQIPAHWMPQRLKFALERNDGGVWGEDLQQQDIENGEMGVIVLRSTEINLDGSWDLSNPARRKLTGEELRKSLLRAGDILITKSSGSEQHLGKSALVTKEIEDLQCAFSNFMQRLRVRSNHNPKFVFYLLNCDVGKEQLGYWGSTTTGLRNLNATIIGEIYLPGAPLLEQRAIAEYLDRETARIDRLIREIEGSIALLQRQRTALISAAVTGKIDVREQK
jgi:type I restriction enzyme S subunit